jgi:hypothetical protein
MFSIRHNFFVAANFTAVKTGERSFYSLWIHQNRFCFYAVFSNSICLESRLWTQQQK